MYNNKPTKHSNITNNQTLCGLTKVIKLLKVSILNACRSWFVTSARLKVGACRQKCVISLV